MEKEKSKEEQIIDDLKQKSKTDLIELILEKEKIMSAARIELEIADHEQMSWLALPVILQDLGFKLKEMPENGDTPPMDIYFKDGVSCYKNSENLWVVTKGDYLMAFKLDTKFHAYQLFSMLGVSFKDEDSSAHGFDKPVEEVLKAGREEIENCEFELFEELMGKEVLLRHKKVVWNYERAFMNEGKHVPILYVLTEEEGGDDGDSMRRNAEEEE